MAILMNVGYLLENHDSMFIQLAKCGSNLQLVVHGTLYTLHIATLQAI